MRTREARLSRRLADARGGEVVFVSHCLLDENVRYLGGAFHSGPAPELIDLLAAGVGVYQMPCPEQRAWGGVLKPRMLRAYGLRGSALFAVRGLLFRLFVAQTRLRYRLLARRVAHDVDDFLRSGVRVLGVVGVGGSPSCGSTDTLDLREAFEIMARCPLAQIDRTTVNERVVLGCRTPGEGLFVRALRRELARRRVDVPFVDYDLALEMRAARQPVTQLLRGASPPGT